MISDRGSWRRGAVGFLILVAVAGCGGGSSEGGDAAENTGDAGTQEEVEETGSDEQSAELTFSHKEAWLSDAMLDKFREDNPDIAVVAEQFPAGDPYKQKLRTLANTGDLPDVIGLPGGPDAEDLVESGHLMDVSDALTTEAYSGGISWAESIQDGLIDTTHGILLASELYSEGQQYLVPQQVVTVVALYNQDAFDEVGIEPPATWDEFMENNRELKEAGYSPLSLIGTEFAQWWLMMTWDQTARDVERADLESGDVKWTDPRILEGFEIVQGMYQEGFFPPSALSNGFDETQALFVTEELAQYVTVPGGPAKYVVENAPFEVGAFRIPGVRGVEPVRTMGGANASAVSADTESPEAAIKLAKYLTSPSFFEQAQDEYVIPPLKGDVLEGSTNRIVQTYAEAASGGFIESQTWVQPFEPEEYDEFQNDIVPGLLTGELSPQEAGERVQVLYDE